LSDLTSPTEVTPTADPTSLFAGLQAKRQEIEDGLRKTLRVPHWPDPEIWVTYRPIQADELEAIGRKADKIKSSAHRNLQMAQDTLITACVKVQGVIDGEWLSFGADPHGEPTRFDEEMATRLELQDKSARSIVKFLFFNDGDLLNMAAAITDFSGLSYHEAEEEFAGESTATL
jgi:hypothetical protein